MEITKVLCSGERVLLTNYEANYETNYETNNKANYETWIKTRVKNHQNR